MRRWSLLGSNLANPLTRSWRLGLDGGMPTKHPVDPDSPTRLHRLIDTKLEPLEVTAYEIVTTGRNAGKSWRDIAAEIAAESGEACSDVNLISWFTPKAAA